MEEKKILVKIFFENKSVAAKPLAMSDTLSSLRENLKNKIPPFANFVFDDAQIDREDEANISVQAILKDGKNIYLENPKNVFPVNIYLNGKNTKTLKFPLSEKLADLRNVLGTELPKGAVFVYENTKLDLQDEFQITLEEIAQDKSKIFLVTPDYKGDLEIEEDNPDLLRSKIADSQKQQEGANQIPETLIKEPKLIDAKQKKRIFDEEKKQETPLRQELPLEEKRDQLPLPGSIQIPSEKNEAGLTIYQYPKLTLSVEDLAMSHTILVVGQTGSGKTTLLNSLINYLLKIKVEDPFRYKVIVEATNKSQAFSQTSEVNVYQIAKHNGFPPLLIVDTPGFGDTRGIQYDKKITDLIEETFRNKIQTLTSVCFVAQSSNARLTSSQKYVFNKVLEIFGNDVAENFIALLTFCDGNEPPILESLKEEGSVFNLIIPKIRDPWYLKFNNSAIFNNKKDKFTTMFWEIGMESFDYLLVRLKCLNPKSLNLSKEVLKERKALENRITALHPLLNQGLNKMEEIKRISRRIEANEDIINQNKDFEMEVQVDQFEKEPVLDGRFTTTCLDCNFTCHNDCSYSEDKDKDKCCAMQNKKCTICPKKCSFEMHKNLPYILKWFKIAKKVTNKDLEKKYYNSKDQVSKFEQIMNGLHDELLEMTYECMDIQEDIKRSIDRLKSIALHSNVYETSEEYINLLIESEKNEHRDGWKERIQALEDLKKQHKEIISLYKNQSAVKNLEDFSKQYLSLNKKKKKKLSNLWGLLN